MAKHEGGYNLPIAGRPTAEVRTLAMPDRLYLGLSSRRFTFSELLVATGDEVRPGQVLAVDPDHHHVPLLAPLGGIAHIDDESPQAIEISHAKAGTPTDDLPPGYRLSDSTSPLARERFKLLHRGAWQFVEDLADGSLPCPDADPSAVVVTTMRLEPFLARGNVLLKDRLGDFVRGLASLRRLSGDKPLHVIFPTTTGPFAEEAERRIAAVEGVVLHNVNLLYPFDDPKLTAVQLGLCQRGIVGRPVWGLGVEGVLAIDEVLTTGKPYLSRILTVGGPAVENPSHVRAVPGYPVDQLVASFSVKPGPVRIISGGVLRGHVQAAGLKGIDAECQGLTLLVEEHQRELFSFVVPGFGKHSICRCFASVVRGRFAEAYTSGLRGERRPCLSCGFCERICPVGILPFLLERYLRHDMLEMANQLDLHRCIGCGLCSYVCTAKLELSRALTAGQAAVRRELHKTPAHAPEQEA